MECNKYRDWPQYWRDICGYNVISWADMLEYSTFICIGEYKHLADNNLFVSSVSDDVRAIKNRSARKRYSTPYSILWQNTAMKFHSSVLIISIEINYISKYYRNETEKIRECVCSVLFWWLSSGYSFNCLHKNEWDDHRDGGWVSILWYCREDGWQYL